VRHFQEEMLQNIHDSFHLFHDQIARGIIELFRYRFLSDRESDVRDPTGTDTVLW
jgi:hypothetical protein